MPIIVDIPQRSDAWFQAICGNCGASSIDRIITTKGEPSKQRTEYMMTLAAERITGKQEVGYLTQAMQNGIDREAEARQLFELSQGVEVQEVGLVYTDDKSCHCSPDGLIGDDAGLEIKNPLSKTHIKYLLDDKIPTEYFCQLQFSLYVTGREVWHFMSHYPAIKPLIVPCYRDEAWIAKCDKELKAFNQELDEMVRRLS
jgi:putative phage-type endonuclease